MVNTKLTRIAMRIAYDKHDGQVDKANVPYIFHPIHVAESMDDEISCCVALLHDIVEDTNTTFEDLEKIFPREVVDAVRLLTHNKNVPYMDYVAKIKENEVSRKVKIADLTHNLDTTRLENITDKDKERIEKYKKALEFLKS